MALAIAAPAIANVDVDKKMPSYSPTQGVSGNIKSVGSDTMNNLMALRRWPARTSNTRVLPRPVRDYAAETPETRVMA